MTLRPFNQDAVCPKCGSSDVYVSHRPNGRDCSYPRRCGMSQFDGEHMDRGCRRCGYVWAEAPLDIEPAATSAPERGGGRGRG